MRLGIFPHHLRSSAKEITMLLLEKLKDSDVEVILRKVIDINTKQCIKLEDNELINTSDLIISIGGDGTFLRALHLIAKEKSKAPILGLNTPGSFGFLNTVNTVEDTYEEINKFLSGKSFIFTLKLLKSILKTQNEVIEVEFINEVALVRDLSSGLPNFSLKISGQILGGYQGDGIIISSAVGSTAQSLSCGGPLISQKISVLNIVPFAPHTINIRPIIISPEEDCEVIIEGDSEVKLHFFNDGSNFASFFPPSNLKVQISTNEVNLLLTDNNYFYAAIRDKFGWGSFR